MTPQSIVECLVGLFPGFAAHWDDPANCFREDDGSFNSYGAFAEFSGYFREHYERLPPDRLTVLGSLVSEWAISADDDLANAVATCFLESVSGERFSSDFSRYLSGEALRYYLLWDRPP
jgi:hypothetical protein